MLLIDKRGAHSVYLTQAHKHTAKKLIIECMHTRHVVDNCLLMFFYYLTLLWLLMETITWTWVRKLSCKVCDFPSLLCVSRSLSVFIPYNSHAQFCRSQYNFIFLAALSLNIIIHVRERECLLEMFYHLLLGNIEEGARETWQCNFSTFSSMRLKKCGKLIK